MKNTILILSLLISSMAFAEKKFGQHDKIVIGNKDSATAKEVEFNTGDGANNKKLSVDAVSKALNFNGNTVNIGDGANVNKAINFNGTGAGLKYDAQRAKVQVNHGDGLYKDLNSGAGAGGASVNLIANGDFEEGLNNWTDVDNIMTVITDVAGGEKAVKITPTAIGQVIKSAGMVAQPKHGVSGLTKYFYKTDADYVTGDWKCWTEDENGNKLRSEVLLPKSETWTKIDNQTHKIENGVKIACESVAVKALYLDEVHVGTDGNFVKVDRGSSFVGSVEWPMNSQDSAWQTNNTTIDTLVSGAVVAVKTEGDITHSNSGTKPTFTIGDMPKGNYTVILSGRFGDVDTTSYHTWSLREATADTFPKDDEGRISAVTQYSAHVPNLVFNFSSKEDRKNVKLGVYMISSGTAYTAIRTGHAPFRIAVKYSPPADSNSVDGYAFEADEEFYRKGYFYTTDGATSARQSATSGYNVIDTQNSLRIVNSRGTSKLACHNADSSGESCASTANVGFSTEVKEAGFYKVCFRSAVHMTSMNSVAKMAVALTPNNSNDVSLISSDPSTAYSSNTGGVGITIETCGEFNLENSGQKTFRLLYNKPTANGELAFYLNYNNALYTSFTMEKIGGSAKHRPYMLNQVKSLDPKGTQIASCKIDGSGSWDSSDPNCSFIESFAYSQPAGGTGYQMQTNLGEDVYKCNIKAHGSCAQTDASIWSKSSMENFYGVGVKPSGYITGYVQCNQDYANIIGNNIELVVSCITSRK